MLVNYFSEIAEDMLRNFLPGFRMNWSALEREVLADIEVWLREQKICIEMNDEEWFDIPELNDEYEAWAWDRDEDHKLFWLQNAA